MQPILIHIPPELFAPAESSHFEGTYAPDVLKSGPDLYTFSDPLHWQVDVTNTGDAFLIGGTIEGHAETTCARCLEAVDIPILGEIEGYFLINRDEKPTDDLEEDEFDILPEDHDVDLVPLLNAALLLEFPLVPLCQEECKGLCPRCGANLNEGPCNCQPSDQSEEPQNNNPFAILKDYDFGN